MTETPEIVVERSASGEVELSGAVWQRIDLWRVGLSPLVFAPIAYVIQRELAGLDAMLFAMGLFFALFVLWRLTRIRDGVSALVSQDEVRVRRRWRSRSAKRSEILTLFVTEIPSSNGWTECWRLVALLGNGEQRELTRTDDAPLALALERALERELDLPAQAVKGAVEGAPPSPRFPYVQLGASVLLLGFVTWQALTTGRTLAELETGDEPARVSFALAEPGSIELKSEIHYSDSIRAPLPHAFVYDVTISKDGEPVAQFQCDPHAAKTMDWTTGSGRNIRAFMVELPGCTKSLAVAGTYALSARRIWRLDRGSVPIASSKLLVYLE